MWAEADRAGAGVVGGDMVSADKLVIAITALGDLEGRSPVTRSGALPGDVLAVCGRLGWAAAGLAVLGRGFRSPVASSARTVPRSRRTRPVRRPRSAGATAMMDVSDGLLADLGHIADASGVGIDVRTPTSTSRARLRRRLGARRGPAALGAHRRRGPRAGRDLPAAADVPEGWATIGTVAAAPASPWTAGPTSARRAGSTGVPSA